MNDNGTPPKVVSIRDGGATLVNVRQGVVELLEEALAEAKSGKTRAVFIATTSQGGQAAEAWDYDHGEGFKLVGAVTIGTTSLVAGVRELAELPD